MISEGSCDTEDWSNDAENPALHHRNKLHFKYFKIENNYFQLIEIFYCIYDKINAALVTAFIRNLFQKTF